MTAVSPKKNMNAAVVRFKESTLEFRILVAMDSAGNYTLRKSQTTLALNLLHGF